LAAGIEAVRRATEETSITIWFPDYFCNEALDLVRCLPVAVKFYPIREDLTPDWPVLEECAASQPGAHVLVLVHYFGFPNAMNEAKAFCGQHSMVLLEDAAHVLIPGAEIGQGDLLIFSPRKLLAVPSGGILVASGDWARHLVDVSRVRRVKAYTIRWLGRRLAQKALLHLHIPWHRLRSIYQGGWFEGNTNVLYGGALEGCDPFVLRLLTVMEQHIEEVIERRRHNYRLLLEWASQLAQARPLFASLPDGVCPYAFPLLVDHGSTNVVARLQACGIPASRWPDLPPEVLAAKEEHHVAMRTHEQLLLLPVHQSLTPHQIDAVGQRLQVALSGK
jgi:dTDP-4-amino-4,6-dideoxygalactose transaminase